jgi:hypothetical protein
MKGAFSNKNSTATEAKFTIKKSAEYTALLLPSIPRAEITAIAASMKNKIMSMLISTPHSSLSC